MVSVAGRPAVRSVVILPCERPLLSFTRPEGKVIPADAPKACRPQVSTNLFLRAPGTLLLRFRGAPQLEHAVQINGTTYRIPPGRTTTVRQRVPAGASNVTALLDWAVSGADEPALTGVDLQQGATAGSLL